MAITGNFSSAGRFYLIRDPKAYEHVDTVSGIVVEMDDDNLRAAAGRLLGSTVEIWPACAPDLAPGECTPENYAHLKARLADVADNLAREVRSNQAAALVRIGLESDLKRVTDDMIYHVDASNRWAGDLESVMIALGVSCERVGDARETILAQVATMQAERDRLSADLAEALGEVKALRETFGIPDPMPRN